MSIDVVIRVYFAYDYGSRLESESSLNNRYVVEVQVQESTNSSPLGQY